MSTPHFAAPFMWNADGTAAVVEQDTREEVEACVLNVLECFLGDWTPDITFGVPDQLFAPVPLQVTGIVAAIHKWEPRAIISVAETGSAGDPSSRTINVEVLNP